MDKVRTQLGYEPETLDSFAEPTLLQSFGEASTLTTQQRFVGMGISVLATCVCWTLVRFCNHPRSAYVCQRLPKACCYVQQTICVLIIRVCIFAGILFSASVQVVRPLLDKAVCAQPCHC